ncbi:type III-B CRISPR module RAMP protein Cmr6 [Aquisalimonas sp.]|uniref:type III-B CRISPR module RAMP protein Cmr6 n=1 Tax=Aquisalimonas sp. TaxID=1872621 RepID=UPI0025C068F4|nr:type III-B CRISPR module RAMP protein Cmr6 [Aquisalimonas sp.]
MSTTATAVRAAVPAYLGSDFADAAPGHRFYLYLEAWDSKWQKPKDKQPALETLARLNPGDRQRMEALAARQQFLAGEAETQAPGCVFSLPACSVAPFTTGLGIEHPLENGFAFLAPYGLPYLPGSSVKGVLRQAARELGDEDGGFERADRDWTRGDIHALFGHDGATDGEYGNAGRSRGALIFWDVLPVLPKDAALQWEVMTPHHGPYYKDASGGTAPHDNGAPVPINFLTVPARSGFRFHVQCDQALLRERAAHLLEGEAWQAVLRELFVHAFEWLGFGAKTSVGYGEMSVDTDTLERERAAREAQRREAEKRSKREAMPAGERLAAELLEGRTDESQPVYKFLLEQLDAGCVPEVNAADFARVVLESLEQRRSELKRISNKKKRQKRLEELAHDEARLRAMMEE